MNSDRRHTPSIGTEDTGMLRENLTDLVAFVAVAREGSFTRASARLGVSQSALSHTVRGMEKRLGVRLLSRTTRKVSPTTEGRQVLERIAPHLEQIEEELAALVAARDRPAGSFRITAIDFATNWLIWPKLREVLRDYPDLKVEIYNDYGLTDIVSEEFDAGVRSGEQVASGMIGVRIGPDFRLVPVAAPGYLEGRNRPEVPDDLTGHLCINLRLPTRGGLLAWWFERDGHETRVRVDGQLTFNQTYQMIEAALDGFGIAYVPDVLVAGHVAEGRLEILLDDWCPPMPGYFLYYPHRRQESRAFSILVEALRHRD